MSFAYHVQVASRVMHRLGLQYIKVRYQNVELKDAVVFDMGTSSESEVTGVPEFTNPEFVQTFSACLDRISFDPFCAANKAALIATATTAYGNGQYFQDQYEQIVENLTIAWTPEYATSANIAGWEVYYNDRWIKVKTMGDRTSDVAKYYLKLGTYGQ
jgi:hypothetical protein